MKIYKKGGAGRSDAFQMVLYSLLPHLIRQIPCKTMIIFKKLDEKKKLQIREQQDRFRGVIFNDEATEQLEAQTVADRISKYFTANKDETILTGLYVVFTGNLVLLTARVTLFLITFNAHYIWDSAVYTIFFSIAPFLCWMKATNYEKFNYKERKMRSLTVFLVNALLLAVTPFFLFGLYAICPYILRHIKISEVFSYGKAQWMCRFAIMLLPTFFLALFGKILYSIYTSDFCRDTLMAFKLSHILDQRKNKKWLYDLSIVNNLKTGKPIVIQESDRGTHFTVTGQTGTGKTATLIYPAIVSDMNQKIMNDDLREKALYEMVQEGKAILNLPEHAEGERIPFRNRYVIPKPGYEKEYQEICEKFKTCCIIAVAPDNDLCDGVARLALARGLEPKFIDPTLESEPERMKEFGQYWYGLNPFAVPRDLKKDINAEAKYIAETAKNVATTLEMINSRNGQGDPFFASVNRNVTSVVTSVCILYCTHYLNRDATWADVQRAIADFKELEPMLFALEHLFGNTVGKGRGQTRGTKDENGILCGTPGSESGVPLQHTPWEATFNYVRDELISESGSKVRDYAYGLRNMINEFLANPYVKRLFSAPEEKCVHIGDSFEDGDIIVVNYGLKLGTDTAIATGLAFQLMVNQAMLNRVLPKNRGQNPSPVFEYVDEMPVILSADWLEPALALGRKYGLVMFTAMQTLAQLNKNDTTKYLKSLLLGVGTIICFGRASTEEMKEISDLSGTEKIEVVQKSKSSSSIIEENPNSSTSERTSMDRQAIIEASDVRNRDFTEVTILTLLDHRVLNAQLGKTHFLKKSDWEKKPRRKINWDKVGKDIPLTKDDKAYIDQLKESLKNNKEPEKKFVVKLATEKTTEDGPVTVVPESDEENSKIS